MTSASESIVRGTRVGRHHPAAGGSTTTREWVVRRLPQWRHDRATTPAGTREASLTCQTPWSRSTPSTDLVEYLLVVFPDRSALGSVVPRPRAGDLDSGSAALDIVVVDRHPDGLLDILELDDVDALAPLAAVDGDLGLLSENDIQLAAPPCWPARRRSSGGRGPVGGTPVGRRPRGRRGGSWASGSPTAGRGRPRRSTPSDEGGGR